MAGEAEVIGAPENGHTRHHLPKETVGEGEEVTANLNAGKMKVGKTRGRRTTRRGGRRTTAIFGAVVFSFHGSSECEMGAGKQQGERGRARLAFVEAGRGETLPRCGHGRRAAVAGSRLDWRGASGRMGKELKRGP